MIARLIQFALLQRIFIFCVFAIGLGFGFRAWVNLPVDAFPDISPTQVKIIIKASGMTAEEVEAQITQPIETELLGIPHQTILRSITKYAIASITLDFEEGTDIYWARQQVSARLSAVQSSLPAIAEGGVAPMSTPLSEMFMFTIENPSLSLQERKHLLDWQIRPALRTVPGVADVNVLGGYTQTFQFAPDIVRLGAYGVTLEQIADQFNQANMNGSVGRVSAGADALVIRTQGRVTSLDAFADIVVANVDGQPLRFKDLGTVTLGSLARYGGVTHNGEETTQALVVALKDSNTAQVVAGVMDKLEAIAPTLAVITLTTADIPANLRTLGQITWHETSADYLATALEGFFTAMGDAAETKDGPSILIIVGTLDVPNYGKSDTYLGDMAAILGATNIADGREDQGPFPGYTQLSMEYILDQDPDYIFTITRGAPDPMPQSMADDPIWSALTAYENGRVIELDNRLFVESPGPRVVEAMLTLYDTLYGAE